MTDSDFTASNAENLAYKWFNTFNEHKMLIGFGAMIALTVCSIYFNFRLGRLNSSATDMTWWIMPLSYSFLDLALLMISMTIFTKAVRGVLWAVSWVWFFFLLGLSLFACLSCIIALDAEKSSSGDGFKRQQLERALADANSSVSTWQLNTKLTVKHKSRFQDRLDGEIEKRDKIVKEISKLDATTPPSQIIFEKMEPFLPIWLSVDGFQTIARLVFGFAMICTPLILGAILSQVFGIISHHFQPDPGTKKRLSPGENNSFHKNKWQNFDNPANTAPISAERAHDTGSEAEPATLDYEALGRVREWLEGESGRITRARIKYRSGNLPYDSVSLIIQELLNEGSLRRLANGQLATPETKLRAV